MATSDFNLRFTVKRICVWVGALALGICAAGGIMAQDSPSSPATDTFASGGNAQTYQDSYSSGCDQKNNSSPDVGGYNPAFCMKLPAENGRCNTIGGANTSLVGQAGNNCYYCQPDTLPTGAHLIVVPADAAANAAYKQGYVCAVALSDPECYLGCYGAGPFVPPPGVTQMGPGNGTAGSTGGQPPQQPMKLQGYVSNAPDPCYPAGPKNYWVCDYPNLPRPPGCTCSTTPAQPPQKATQTPPKPTSQPTSSAPDQGNYLLGLLGGLNNCAQGIGSIMGGIGYFMEGDFTDAATMWGLEPGQSVMLKTISAEMSTPVVGSNVTPYQQGVAAGQRICTYILIPAAGKAVGSALRGKPAPTTLKGTIKQGAPPPGTGPGSTQQNPIAGEGLKEALEVDEKGTAPAKALEGKWVELQNGPEQLGPYRAQGGLAAVYNKGANQVMKIAKSGPDGDYNDSIKGQVDGAKILKSLDVETPDLSDYQPGSANVPGSVVADDLAAKYPGAFELTAKKFQSMSPVQQQAILDAVDTEMNKIAGGDYALLDTNPSNISVQPIGDVFKAIIHDPDFLMTMEQIDAEVAADEATELANKLAKNDPNNTAPPKPLSLPLGVLDGSLQLGGKSMYLKGVYANAQELMQTLNQVRIDRLKAPLQSSPAGGAAPASVPSNSFPGTLPVNPGSGTLPAAGPN